MLTEEIKGAYKRTKWALVLRGLVSLAIGILILVRPADSVAAFALVIAIWALVEGFVRIVQSFELRSLAKHWWVLLLAGLVSVAFGAAAIYYYPALSLAFAIALTAFWLLSAGILAIYAAIQERRIGVGWGWTMTFGILAVVAGGLAFMSPGVTLAWIMGLISAFAIIAGIVQLVGAGKMGSLQRDVKGAMEDRDRTDQRHAA